MLIIVCILSIVNFTWDESKRQENIVKHGLDFIDAERVFAGPMVLFEDDRADYGEQRMIGIGLLDYLVVLIVQRVRKGSFIAEASGPGRFWFAVTGICNGLSLLTLFAALRNGPITLVAPVAAIYPLVTLLLSAMVLRHVRITPRIVAGAVLTVAGVALVLVG